MAGEELWAALGLPASGAQPHAVHAARPAALGDNAWATVVVLAYLRARLSGQRAVWGDMEAKALAWLAGPGVWPASGCKSVGATVLATAKLLTA